jgi:hypothetical protein
MRPPEEHIGGIDCICVVIRNPYVHRLGQVLDYPPSFPRPTRISFRTDLCSCCVLPPLYAWLNSTVCKYAGNSQVPRSCQPGKVSTLET